jgi:hypothetical protein
MNADEDPNAPVPTVKGAAYIFARQSGSWHQQQKLLNPSNGTFASAVVETDGARVFVDAHYIRAHDEDPLTDVAAKVFMYRRQHGEWTNTDVLVPPTPSNQFALDASLARCQFLTSDATVSTPDPVFDGEAYIYALGSCED